MTYGELYKEFKSKVQLKDVDWRPCSEMFGVPNVPNAILVYLDDGSKVIYIGAEKPEDEQLLKKLTTCSKCVGCTCDCMQCISGQRAHGTLTCAGCESPCKKKSLKRTEEGADG